MEVVLITGFLGAGKTTLIRHLLRSGFGDKKKVAVIVNEVGKAGIDGIVITRSNAQILLSSTRPIRWIRSSLNGLKKCFRI